MTLFGYDISQLAVGILLGAAIFYFLMKSLSGIFPPFDGFNNFRPDYHAHRGYRDRRGGNGFIFFLLFLAVIFFAVKKLSIGNLESSAQKSKKEIAAISPEIPVPVPQSKSKNIGEGEPLYAPPDYIYPDKETVSLEVQNAGVEASQPTGDQYIIQTDCVNDHAQALGRAKELHQKYGLPHGVIVKETAGQTKYASFVGPFPSKSKAESINQKYGLQGWVQPSPNLENLEP